jgi:hypothetical protein
MTSSNSADRAAAEFVAYIQRLVAQGIKSAEPKLERKVGTVIRLHLKTAPPTVDVLVGDAAGVQAYPPHAHIYPNIKFAKGYKPSLNDQVVMLKEGFDYFVIGVETHAVSDVINANQLQGIPIKTAKPVKGDTLVFTGSAWVPEPISSSGYVSLTGAGETATPGALVQKGPFTVLNTAAFGSGTGIDLKDTGDAGILITNNGSNITYAGAGICVYDPDVYGISIISGANPYTGSPAQGHENIDIINSQVGVPVMLFEGGSSAGINLVTTNSKIQLEDSSSGITIATSSVGVLTITTEDKIVIENTAVSGGGITIKDATGSGIDMSTSIGLLFVPQKSSAPTYVKGGMYFDTTLNKLRIGGATGWETVTSA